MTFSQYILFNKIYIILLSIYGSYKSSISVTDFELILEN